MMFFLKDIKRFLFFLLSSLCRDGQGWAGMGRDGQGYPLKTAPVKLRLTGTVFSKLFSEPSKTSVNTKKAIRSFL